MDRGRVTVSRTRRSWLLRGDQHGGWFKNRGQVSLVVDAFQKLRKFIDSVACLGKTTRLIQNPPVLLILRDDVINIEGTTVWMGVNIIRTGRHTKDRLSEYIGVLSSDTSPRHHRTFYSERLLQSWSIILLMAYERRRREPVRVRAAKAGRIWIKGPHGVVLRTASAG